METKKMYQSKIVILNVITTLVAVLSLTDLQTIINPKLALLIVSILNVVLRIWFTNTVISK